MSCSAVNLSSSALYFDSTIPTKAFNSSMNKTVLSDGVRSKIFNSPLKDGREEGLEGVGIASRIDVVTSLNTLWALEM